MEDMGRGELQHRWRWLIWVISEPISPVAESCNHAGIGPSSTLDRKITKPNPSMRAAAEAFQLVASLTALNPLDLSAFTSRIVSLLQRRQI